MSDDRQREWAELGQSLAQAKLEQLGDEIAVAFRQTASKVARGEEITEGDIRELYDCLEDAKTFVDEFATVAPGSRRLDFVEHMTKEEIQRVATRIDDEDKPRQ